MTIFQTIALGGFGAGFQGVSGSKFRLKQDGKVEMRGYYIPLTGVLRKKVGTISPWHHRRLLRPNGPDGGEPGRCGKCNALRTTSPSSDAILKSGREGDYTADPWNVPCFHKQATASKPRTNNRRKSLQVFVTQRDHPRRHNLQKGEIIFSDFRPACN